MANKAILVVDDSQFMRNLIGNAIKGAGYEDLHYAEDGNAAVAFADAMKPDLITLDISMPGMDGVETVLKILEVCPSAKIVMISAVTSQIVIKEALKNGAVDFMKKPVDRNEIEDMLKRHLG